MITNEQLASDYRDMIKADMEHLKEQVRAGHRVNAHRLVDSIIDTQRALEDLEAKIK